ncbi:membrane-bound alpha-1,6- mannosyltransferase Initiation-specific [Dinochytrium kinnereticum]|nr:membrane-bound alpha-1,6- mannosyltransferase Initiation-specific [Dinochytrium kinnereticum]
MTDEATPPSRPHSDDAPRPLPPSSPPSPLPPCIRERTEQHHPPPTGTAPTAASTPAPPRCPRQTLLLTPFTIHAKSQTAIHPRSPSFRKKLAQTVQQRRGGSTGWASDGGFWGRRGLTFASKGMTGRKRGRVVLFGCGVGVLIVLLFGHLWLMGVGRFVGVGGVRGFGEFAGKGVQGVVVERVDQSGVGDREVSMEEVLKWSQRIRVPNFPFASSSSSQTREGDEKVEVDEGGGKAEEVRIKDEMGIVKEEDISPPFSIDSDEIVKGDGGNVKLDPRLNPFAPEKRKDSHAGSLRGRLDVDDLKHRYFIPRTIHITVPNKFLLDMTTTNIVEKWKSLNPGFTIHLYDDDDMRDLVKQVSTPSNASSAPAEFPTALEVYDSFERSVEKADFWRYLIIYLKGGVYIDSDVAPLQPIDTWSDAFDPYVVRRAVKEGYGGPHQFRDNGPPANAPLLQGFVGMEGYVKSDYERMRRGFTSKIQFCQWAFAFRKGHPFLSSVILRILDEVGAERRHWRASPEALEGWRMGVLQRTGPGVWSRAVEAWMKEYGWVKGRTPLGWVSWLFHRYPRGSRSRVTSGDIIQQYEIVNTVGLMPVHAFAHGDEPQGPRSISEEHVLIRHLFRGSWKEDDGLDGWIRTDKEIAEGGREGLRNAFGVTVSEDALKGVMGGVWPPPKIEAGSVVGLMRGGAMNDRGEEGEGYGDTKNEGLSRKGV